VCISGLQVIGYLLMTKVKITTQNKEIPSLALGPMAVLPQYQKQGNGAKLVEAAHKVVPEIGFKSAVVLGDNKYCSLLGIDLLKIFIFDFPFQQRKRITNSNNMKLIIIIIID
jgi:predicted N-acetyltransferase YhbS